MTANFHFGMFARNTLGNYPTLCFLAYKYLKPERREFLTDRDTQVVIEGFPRSANGFMVSVFKNTQPQSLKIAHHMYLPSQVIRGVQFNIPTIVLIREPKAAIASFLTYRINSLQSCISIRPG